MTPRFNVGARGTFLATRASGQLMRAQVESMLAHGSVVLNFSGVEAITVAFADELVANLFKARMAGQFADRTIGIERFSGDVWETLQTALSRRGIEMPT